MEAEIYHKTAMKQYEDETTLIPTHLSAYSIILSSFFLSKTAGQLLYCGFRQLQASTDAGFQFKVAYFLTPFSCNSCTFEYLI